MCCAFANGGRFAALAIRARDQEFLSSYETIDKVFAAEHAAKADEMAGKKQAEKVEVAAEVVEEKKDEKAVHLTVEEQNLARLQKQHELDEKRREAERAARRAARDKVRFLCVLANRLDVVLAGVCLSLGVVGVDFVPACGAGVL